MAEHEPATIREAQPADLWAIRDLLSARDERPWSDAQTDWFVHGLDPGRCRGWLAWSGERPVGLTTMFLRELRVGGETTRAGYWANLYILPEYRGQQMLYPRLPLAMLPVVKRDGLSFVFAAVRLRDVTKAHLHIGFVKLGQLPVLIKPLRPARLVARHYGRGTAIQAACSPVDAVYRAYLAVRRRRSSGSGRTEPADLVDAFEQQSRNLIGQIWTADAFRYRFQTTRDGTPYYTLAAREGGETVAALIYRFADRNGIRMAVIMDGFCAQECASSLQALLGEAERHAVSDGCDAAIVLDGLGGSARAGFKRTGYRPFSERYDILVWPKDAVSESSPIADLANWSFSFADHDAF
jgi:hypothetical protein